MPQYGFFSQTLFNRPGLYTFTTDGSHVKGHVDNPDRYYKSIDNRVVVVTLVAYFDNEEEAKKYLKEKYSKYNPDAIFLGEVTKCLGKAN